MNAETRRVLQESRRLIIERGWAARASGWTRPEVCLGAAIDISSYGAVSLIRDAADALGFTSCLSELFAWNDAQPSAGPVIALLDKVLAESGRDFPTSDLGRSDSPSHTSRPEPQVVA